MPKRRSKPNSEQEAATPRPFWSGTLTFGLVSVPVNLFPANRESRVAFRTLSKEGHPLARRYYSATTGKELEDDQILRGYEYIAGKFVTVSDEELERLAPEKSRDIALTLFVPKEEVSPLYFERAYFLTPAGSSVKAYRLLAETMEQSGSAGIGKFVMHGKEYLVSIFSENKILNAETMRFADEVRSPQEIGLPAKKKVATAAIGKFDKLIKARSAAHLSREEIRNTETERLLKLIEQKHKRDKDVVEVEGSDKPAPAKVVDLMEVLKAALKQRKAA